MEIHPKDCQKEFLQNSLVVSSNEFLKKKSLGYSRRNSQVIPYRNFRSNKWRSRRLNSSVNSLRTLWKNLQRILRRIPDYMVKFLDECLKEFTMKFLGEFPIEFFTKFPKDSLESLVKFSKDSSKNHRKDYIKMLQQIPEEFIDGKLEKKTADGITGRICARISDNIYNYTLEKFFYVSLEI